MQELSVMISKKKSLTYEDKTFFYDKGEQECVELKFLDGNTLTCTSDHKIYTDKGWMLAKDIKINETNIIKNYINPTLINLNEKNNWSLKAGDIELSCVNINEKRKAIAYCRMLGYMLTDGCLFYNNSLKKKTIVSYVYFSHEHDANNFAKILN